MNINNNVDSPKPDPDYIKVNIYFYTSYKFQLNRLKLYRLRHPHKIFMSVFSTLLQLANNKVIGFHYLNLYLSKECKLV